MLGAVRRPPLQGRRALGAAVPSGRRHGGGGGGGGGGGVAASAAAVAAAAAAAPAGVGAGGGRAEYELTSSAQSERGASTRLAQ